MDVMGAAHTGRGPRGEGGYHVRLIRSPIHGLEWRAPGLQPVTPDLLALAKQKLPPRRRSGSRRRSQVPGSTGLRQKAVASQMGCTLRPEFATLDPATSAG